MKNRMKIKHHIFLCSAIALLLTSCSGFFDKDNTPSPSALKPIKTEVRPRLLWSSKVGTGTDGQYLKLSPTVTANAIYTSDTDGIVTAVTKESGKRIWQIKSQVPVISSPGVGEGLVVVGSRRGDIVALDQNTGGVRWKTSIPGAILATPAVQHRVVVIKTIDGQVKGLSTETGEVDWSYKHLEPNMILRGASAPLIRGKDVVVGFASGNLAKLSLQDGRLFWIQPIATPEGAYSIDRMIDIDANPILYGQHIYAATYQGNIASLDWTSGKILWSHDLSSYTGMIADSHSVYVSDANSLVWAFDTTTGDVRWSKNELAYRVVSGPAIMGRYIVLGDAEGYLHWMDKYDGHLAGRISAGSPIYASPIVENNVLYAMTAKGYLLAYTI